MEWMSSLLLSSSVAAVTPGELPTSSSLELNLRSDAAVSMRVLPDWRAEWSADAEVPPPRRPAPFGEEGSWRFNLGGGFGLDVVDANSMFTTGLGVSYFVADNFSFEVELNLLHFNQSGPDAWAVNANLLLRWHLFAQEHWSFYLDGGAGLLAATQEVPPAGSEFNFTPQAGAGVSFRVADDVRMLVGVRWHHLSNARTEGSNPGRDHVLLYAGLSFPF